MVVNSTVLVASVIGARLAGVPVIVHAQEAPKTVAARRLFRVHGALAHTVIAISPWIARAFDGARASVVLNPVGIHIPGDPGPRALCAADPVRLVLIGTVDRHTRQDVAIAAVRALRERGVEAELTLLGIEADRAYATELRDQARDLDVARQVHFAGPTSDVAARLLAADALLLPAGEVTPLVLMEAMALGTPVVAARMGSIPDVVTDEVNGLLVAPDDPAGLAAAVVRLRGEAGLADRLAEAGRRRVERDFDETQAHRRLAAEIARLTAGRADWPSARRGRGSRRVLRRRLGASWRRLRAAALRWRLRGRRPASQVRSSTTERTPRSRRESRSCPGSPRRRSSDIYFTCDAHTSWCQPRSSTARCSRAGAAGRSRSRSPSTTTSQAI